MNLRSILCFFLFLLSAAGLSWRASAQEIANEEELQSQLETGKKLLGQTADRGAVLFFIAATYAQLKEPHAAMENLKECIALKEGFDPVGEPSFAGLRDSKEFQTLTDQVHKDFPVVSTAQLAFTSTEKDLVPEGLAWRRIDVGSGAWPARAACDFDATDLPPRSRIRDHR